MKKVLALVLALCMVFALCACGSSASTTAAAATEAPAAEATEAPAEEAPAEEAPAEEAVHYNVGICQLVQHVALDAASQGFMDAITDALGEDAVTFDYQNASGETANCATIVNGFVSDNVDLILANATAPLQAAASATATIPILGTSITDYASALEISDFTGVVGGNISGCSDLAPLDQQAAMVQELFPDAKTVGLIYCTAEANSVYQCSVMAVELEALGYEVAWFGFNDTNDVASVTQAACDACDVLYIPTDNTAAANTEAIANIVLAAGVPVVAGEEGICSGCGVATLSINYYDLGYATGKMAVKVLTGEEDISTMAISYAENVTKEYNAANCEALGITIPEGYTAIG